MRIFETSCWPIWFVAAVMLAAAVINCGPRMALPNLLTLPFWFGGLVLGLLHEGDSHLDAGIGGVGAALAGSGIAFLLLLPGYLIHAVGAGSLKLQMGFGAWVGAFYGLPSGALVVIWATGIAVLILDSGRLAAGESATKGTRRGP